MTAIPLGRRVALAALSLTCAAALFRGQVASALVTRGDDVLRAGDASGALRYYARAIRIDPRSAVAPDRLAFSLILRRGRGDAARAYDVAAQALRVVPDDPALRADRAFAAQRLARWRYAERDFARRREPRARSALRAPRRAAGASHARPRAPRGCISRDALRLDPRYAPARALLREVGS